MNNNFLNEVMPTFERMKKEIRHKEDLDDLNDKLNQIKLNDDDLVEKLLSIISDINKIKSELDVDKELAAVSKIKNLLFNIEHLKKRIENKKNNSNNVGGKGENNESDCYWWDELEKRKEKSAQTLKETQEKNKDTN